MTLRYIKLFEKILGSEVECGGDTLFAAFVRILLIADWKTSLLEMPLKDLQKRLRHGSKNTTYSVLEKLQKIEIIEILDKNPLKISVKNWHKYQLLKVHEMNSESSPNELVRETKEFTKRTPKVHEMNSKVHEMNSESSPNELLDIKMYPRNYFNVKKFKKLRRGITEKRAPFFAKRKNNDAELLGIYFLQKTNDPILKKDKQKIVKNLKPILPHLKNILDRAENLDQAKKILEAYIKKCEEKGKPASLNFLTQDLDYYRKTVWQQSKTTQMERKKKEPELSEAERREQERWNALSEEERKAELKKLLEDDKK
ncbi:MAG: hypothetical protein LBG46_03120 [Elusimicrobiota bacterium]|jgi:hypothetical protein|nr:hypothetical protein [Elusimicrobiota bacterium]